MTVLQNTTKDVLCQKQQWIEIKAQTNHQEQQMQAQAQGATASVKQVATETAAER